MLYQCLFSLSGADTCDLTTDKADFYLYVKNVYCKVMLLTK